MSIRHTIKYSTTDGNWTLKIKNNNTIEVDFQCTDDEFDTSNPRVYDIPKGLKEIEVDGEYVYLIYKKKVYQCKFEDGGNFVGDIMETTGDHIETFACYNFFDDIFVI